jgi:hypothetical protein
MPLHVVAGFLESDRERRFASASGVAPVNAMTLAGKEVFLTVECLGGDIRRDINIYSGEPP